VDRPVAEVRSTDRTEERRELLDTAAALPDERDDDDDDTAAVDDLVRAAASRVDVASRDDVPCCVVSNEGETAAPVDDVV